MLGGRVERRVACCKRIAAVDLCSRTHVCSLRFEALETEKWEEWCITT